jgi:hypothetical protein
VTNRPMNVQTSSSPTTTQLPSAPSSDCQQPPSSARRSESDPACTNICVGFRCQRPPSSSPVLVRPICIHFHNNERQAETGSIRARRGRKTGAGRRQAATQYRRQCPLPHQEEGA